MRISPYIKHLLIINLLMFAIAALNLIPDFSEITALWFIKNPNFHWWQFISHMFMHANLSHLLFNMFALYSFGVVFEQLWGGKKFLFFYISCGLGAALLHLGVTYFTFQQDFQSFVNQGISPSELYNFLNDPHPYQWIDKGDVVSLMRAYQTHAVGASGAIYGILVAFGMSFPEAELMLIFLPIPIKAKYFIPGLILFDLFSGISQFSIFGDNIAHFAHIGGGITGFFIYRFWKNNQFKRWDQ